MFLSKSCLHKIHDSIFLIHTHLAHGIDFPNSHLKGNHFTVHIQATQQNGQYKVVANPLTPSQKGTMF